jgi:hypothetical protein
VRDVVQNRVRHRAFVACTIEGKENTRGRKEEKLVLEITLVNQLGTLIPRLEASPPVFTRVLRHLEILRKVIAGPNLSSERTVGRSPGRRRSRQPKQR